MRHSALADLCPAAMHAGVFEYHCGSFRSLLLSSLRKESSACIEFCEFIASLFCTQKKK